MIRDFKRSDQDAVCALIQAGMRERWAARFDPEANADTEDLWGHYIRKGGEIIVVEVEGSVIGTGTLLPEDRRAGRVLRMAVDLAHRRQGVGKTIVSELIVRARRRGLLRLRASTDTPWADAVSFYKACGFLVVTQTDAATDFQLEITAGATGLVSGDLSPAQ